MNKKKRALSLGLAVTQLSALTAVVAPLTAVVAFADTITANGQDHTVTLPGSTTGYTVTAAADSDDSTKIKVTITIASGYVAAASANPSVTVSGSAVSFTATDNGDGVTTGWEGSFTADSGSAQTYDLSNITGVDVLKVITPVLELKSGSTGVDLSADTTEASDSGHTKAIEEAKKIVNVAGVGDLTADTHYEVTYAWDSTNNNAVIATFALKSDGESLYSIAKSGATTTLSVPVTYKAAAKALTFAVDASLDLGEQAAEPSENDMIAAIKEKVKISVDGTESTTLTENTDYTLTIEKDTSDADTSDGQKFTVTLASAKADEYAVADGDKTKTVNVTYTVAAAKTNITATIANISFDNELDAAPTADEVKGKIAAVTFAQKSDSTSVTDLTLGTDYDVNVTLDNSDPDSLVYKAAITLKNTDNAKKYAFDGTDNEVTLTVNYTLKSEVTIASIVNSVTPVTTGNLANELEVTLVDADSKDLTGGSAKVKEGAELTLTVKPKTGFAFKSDSALSVSAALTNASSTTITPTNNNDGTYTITVPALDAADTLTISLTGALEVKTVSVTDFEFGYGSGKTAYEVDYKTALSDATIKSALELTSITTADGKITDATELGKFDLSVTVDSSAGTATVTITTSDTAYEVDSNLAAKNVKIVKTITVAGGDVLSGSDLTYAVTAGTLAAADVKTAIESQVSTAVTKLTATGGKFDGLNGILTLTAGAATLDAATGNYKVTVTPSVAAGSAEAYKLTSETPLEYTITVTKLDVTPGTIALKASASEVTLSGNKANTTEADIKTAVLAALDEITFTVTTGGGAVTLTKDTDYTVDVTAVNTTAKTATVTVAPVASSMATFTQATGTFNFIYTATKLTAPTTTATSGSEISIAGNGDVETLAKSTITLPTGTTEDDFTITIDKSAFTSTGSGATTTVDVKFTIKDADNFAWDDNVTAAGGVVTVTVNVTKAADVPELTPTLGGKYIEGTPEILYINGELTADSIKTALGADLTASFTKPDAAGTGTEQVNDVASGDWEAVVSYTSGTSASISIKLTAAGAAKYVLASTPATATITVKRAYALPNATTATITDPFANGTSAADIKTAVEAKVATLFTTAADYTITSATPTTADGEQTVDVTVTPKDTNGAFDNTAHDATITVTVTYTVSAATPAGNAVTVSAATNGTVTADKTTAASGDTVTLTIAPASGYKLDALTITGASGAVTPTKVNDTTYTFEMPAEAVTVSATFVDASAQTQSAPAAPTMKTRTNTSITLNTIAANANGAAAEYSKDGTTWQTSPTFSGLTKNTSYTFYARYAAVEGFTASPASVGTAIKTTNTSSGGSSSGGGHSSGGSSWRPSSGGSTSSGSRPADSSSKTTPNITNDTADDINDVIDTKPTAANLSKITDTAEDVEKALKDISKPTVVEKQAATVLESALRSAKLALTETAKAEAANNIQLIMKALSTKAPKVRGDADNSGKVDSADVLLSVLNFRKYRTNAAGQLYTAVTMGVTDKTALNTNDILAFIKAFRTR